MNAVCTIAQSGAQRLREVLSGKKWSVLYEFHGAVTHPFDYAALKFSPSLHSDIPYTALSSLNQFQKSGRVVQNANKTDGGT